MMLLVLGLCFLAAAAMVAMQALMRPRTVRHASLQRVKDYAHDRSQTQTVPGEANRTSLLQAAVPPLSKIALRLTPRVQRDELAGRLTAAGLAARVTPQQFLALKTVLGSLGIVLGLAAAGISPRGLAFAILLAGASVILPDFLLRRRALARAERLTADLPEAIDQIVVSLEAGVSFDAAVSFYTRRSKSGLARELQVMLSELRMGESRSNALRRLADRVPSADMRNFVQTLLQSESIGMSRSGILAAQAEDLRHRRQTMAEELAQKAPVKMLFPLLIFIMPVMLVIILGPALQQMSRLLG
jgi:tight adherence protein C